MQQLEQQIAQLTSMIDPQKGAEYASDNGMAPQTAPSGQGPIGTSRNNALGNAANSVKATTQTVARQRAANSAAPR